MANPAAASTAPAASGAPAAATSPPAVAPATAKPPPTAAELQRAAVAQQRAASRKQAENLGLWLMPLEELRRPQPTGSADCDPLDEARVNPLIEDAAKQQNLEAKVIRAVIEQESAVRPCAVSAKGAQGLMQLMPETAAGLGVANPFDPKQNVDAGARYLRQLLDKYKGDMGLALGAYNAGPRTVDDAGGVPDIQETREYVDAILAKAGLKPADPIAAQPTDAPAPLANAPTAPAIAPIATPKPPDMTAPAPAEPVKLADPNAVQPAGTLSQPAAAPAKPTTAPAKSTTQ